MMPTRKLASRAARGAGPVIAVALLAWPSARAAELRIVWDDPPQNDETGFEIERRTGFFGGYSWTVFVEADRTEYVDSDLEPETTYCYRLRAVRGDARSPYSGQACAQTPAAE